MNLERALATPGWMDPGELKFLAMAAAKSHTIAEIGSWRGRSARVMMDNSDSVLFCTDTWADNAYGNPGWWTESDGPEFCKMKDWLWDEFRKNLADSMSRIVTARTTSVEAAGWYAKSGFKFDAIFIDAGHDYDSVMNDIIAWRPLLAEGGMFMGHDYHPNTNPEVVKAVDELVGPVDVIDTIWVAR